MSKKIATLLTLMTCILTITHAQIKGEWYTWSTGNAPMAQLNITEKTITVINQDAGFRPMPGEQKLSIIKDIDAKGKTYLVHVSIDSLFFCTSLRYDRAAKCLWMYCPDGADDGYKTMDQLLAAIKKDTGSHFAIALYKKEEAEKQLSRKAVTGISSDQFRDALQTFNNTMDQFWQYRGYGRYEPFEYWTDLIFGNAWANAFPDTYNKQSLTPKAVKALVRKFEKDPEIHKLLIAAGLIQE